MTKEKPLEELIEKEDDFEKEIDELELDDDDDLRDIIPTEDNLENIEEDAIEIEERKNIKNISMSSSSESLKRALANRPVPQKEITPVLEQTMETNSKQNLEMQLQEAPILRNENKEELDYSGQKKEESELYGEGKKIQGTYDPHTKTTRFNEDSASVFDSDQPRELTYTGTRTDGTQEKGIKNEYEVRGANMKIKRFDKGRASAFDSDQLREYEFE